MAKAKKPGKKRPREKPLVGKQPQSKSAAANQAGMFLHTDDAWSLAYFDPNDLHHLERQLFAKG
jgi:hypothetical protein